MSEIKKKTENELQALLIEKREVVKNFRFNASGSKAKNNKEGRNTRREIARILTEMKARKLAKI